MQAAGISSSVSRHTLLSDETQFFDLGTLNDGEVAFGIITPVSGLPFDFDTPDTMLATFFTAEVGPGDLSSSILTINDDSDADTNVLEDESLGSLFRLEAFEDEYTVGVTGFDDGFTGSGHDQEGDYLLTLGVVDPDSLGGDIADTDGTNELLSGADLLTLANGEAQVSVNSLVQGVPGDVDFYRIDLEFGDVLTVMTAPLNGLSDDFDDPDTQIIFFDSTGTKIFDDDDAGGLLSDLATNQFLESEAFGSALHFMARETDTYYFAVTGFPGEEAIGDHQEQGAYALLVSRVLIIPEPGSLILLNLGGILLGLGRRRA